MERCEGYYRLENRRCDRPGNRDVTAADGETYLVCAYHARQGWAASVARWHDESDVRAGAPTSRAVSARTRSVLRRVTYPLRSETRLAMLKLCLGVCCQP
jgi:hypothetical protein